MTTLTKLCARVRIVCHYGKATIPYDQMDEWQKRASNYRVTLRYRGKRMTLNYFMGEAHTTEPTAEGVLESLLLDASCADESFSDWCANYGFDDDSRKAERIYKQVQRQTDKLRNLLGDDFDSFMQSDR